MKGQFRVKPEGKDLLNLRYRVEGKINGVRKRFFFSSASEAEKCAAQKNKELRHVGHALAHIDPSLRADALYAQERGVPIRAAVDYWLSHHDMRSKSILVKDACLRARTWSKARLKAHEIGRDMHYGITIITSKLESAFGETLMCDLTSFELSNWLDSLPVSTVSKNTYRVNLSRVFSYAKEQRWVSTNPVLEFKPKRDREAQRRMRAIYSLEQAARLLEAADPTFVPFLAIGLFAGLRPSETLRLNWEDINWEEKQIHVPAIISKTGERRFTTMQENLIEWLAPYRQSTGPIFAGGFKAFVRVRRASRKAAGVQWLKDGLRHSFSSYHCAWKQNEALTAHEAGHSIATMKKHYLKRVIPKEGAAYFALLPGQRPSNVVEMVAA